MPFLMIFQAKIQNVQPCLELNLALFSWPNIWRIKPEYRVTLSLQPLANAQYPFLSQKLRLNLGLKQTNYELKLPKSRLCKAELVESENKICTIYLIIDSSKRFLIKYQVR